MRRDGHKHVTTVANNGLWNAQMSTHQNGGNTAEVAVAPISVAIAKTNAMHVDTTPCAEVVHTGTYALQHCNTQKPEAWPGTWTCQSRNATPTLSHLQHTTSWVSQ